MVWQRPGRRALVATLTVVASLLPLFLIVAVSALGDAPPGGDNSGAGPAIVGFSPRQGTIGGGTVVHISGGGFSEVTGVSFGDQPARSFVVESDNLINAETPSMPRGTSLRIGIAASGGTAISHATFSFVGCHVPRLAGARVGRARKELVAAGCKVGRVATAADARGPLRVIEESPHPGTWLEPGTPVALRVR
jgi:IPT/TIG domain